MVRKVIVDVEGEGVKKDLLKDLHIHQLIYLVWNVERRRRSGQRSWRNRENRNYEGEKVTVRKFLLLTAEYDWRRMLMDSVRAPYRFL